MPEQHRSHHHELSLKTYKRGYICDGCKTDGYGERYRCIESCEYDLHKECMHLSPTRTLESFPGLTFQLLDEPPKSACGRACDVCKKDVEGFVYHCPEKGLDVHPLCASLKKEIRVDDVEFELEKGERGKCRWCKRTSLAKTQKKIPGFCYVSRCGEYSFHVHCVMNMAIESAARASRSTADVDSYSWDNGRELAVRGNGRGRSKLFRVVKMFLKVVLSILIGDPTAILASVVVEMLTV